jgi:ABC-type phosphate/phosphonate transport system substrate-binding protein
VAKRKSKTKPTKAGPKTGSIAAYTMYGLDWLRTDVRVFWDGVASRLRDAGMSDVPSRLTWKMPEVEQWHAPNLLLGQTCGYPLMKGLTGDVRLVVTPSYIAPFVEGTSYASLIVVAKDSGITSLAQLKGGIAVVNGITSHSGYNAFRRLVADYVHQEHPMRLQSRDRGGQVKYFSEVIVSGKHHHSLAYLASGKADVASIDAVSFHLISKGRPELTDAVKVLTTTLPAPGLPLITAGTRSDDELRTLRAALLDTLGDAEIRSALKNLGINGFQVLGRDAYQRTLEIEREAEDLGYPVLV